MTAMTDQEVLKRFRAWRRAVELILKYRKRIEEAADLREAFYYLRGIAWKHGYVDVYQRLQKEERYDYFTQDILSRLEAWGVIKSRPPARPVGFYLKEGVLKFITDILRENMDKYKGIIFVEKESVAKRLAELSEIGYMVMAGQGYPTRLMREAAKRGKLFVLHDADRFGNNIYRVFVEGAKRLKRISRDYAMRWIVKHARDLGLAYDDAEKLGLDPEPEPEQPRRRRRRRKYGKRYELQALIKLQIEHNITNPYLAYAAYKLEQLGEDLRPRILEPTEMYTRKVSFLVATTVMGIAGDIVRKHASNVIKDVQHAGQKLLDGLRLREDLVRSIAERSLRDIADAILSKKFELEITSHDLTIIIGGVSNATDPDDFLHKFKQKHGVYKIAELLS